MVTAIIESGKNLSEEQKKTERCPLLYEWHKKQYIGVAHGLAGIYYVLMQVIEVNGCKDTMKRVNYEWWEEGVCLL